MRRPASALTTGLALSACLLAAACGGDDEPELTGSSSSSSVTATPQASAGPGSAAPTAASSPEAPAAPGATSGAPAGSAADSTEAPVGGPLTVTEVRVARQDGFDRVVFELAGQAAGQPGWRIGYSDDPRRAGSGDPVELDADAVLAVLIDGTGYPFDTGQVEASSVTVPADTEVVQEVQLGAVYEGTYEAFIGVDGEAPFTVTRLADPARVVIDIAHG